MQIKTRFHSKKENRQLVEILGSNLKKFFDVIDNPPNEADITYAGNRYEVWEVSDDLFEKMCNMSEEEFVEIAGEDAWWRQSYGSNLGYPEETTIVNGNEIEYENLSEYLCECIGVSQPRNVCACAMDLAKYNDMTMGELFEEYEG